MCWNSLMPLSSVFVCDGSEAISFPPRHLLAVNSQSNAAYLIESGQKIRSPEMLYIHAGTGKTGTTYLQSYFAANAQRLGLRYPTIGRQLNGAPTFLMGIMRWRWITRGLTPRPNGNGSSVTSNPMAITMTQSGSCRRRISPTQSSTFLSGSQPGLTALASITPTFFA